MKTIIEMAREAGLYTKCEVHSAVPFDQLLERFAELVRADEREACAKVCDEIYGSWINIHGRYEFMAEGAEVCANEIRERGNT
jgi:hypothetical protein